MHKDVAPWGHDWYPTVWEGTRGRPGEAIATAIGAVMICGFVYLIATDAFETGNLSSGAATVLAIVLALVVWWLLMFAQIRGWIGPAEFNDD
jgi:peptidoglycan biosynthesis protein MviN/MurJ (putative lipid II flippase)